ncbi:MAG: hypothetical protein K2X66_15345, partial [Cyanobacteria bacterium]|nr:hypothetical protein [Cyanobacteriota bacterium]
LAPNGQLIDNESENGRMVGTWRRDETNEYYLNPYHGPQKKLSNLLKKEKYQFNPDKMILMAPPWLDPIGDVKLGPPPTNTTPSEVSGLIHKFRYVKPPDDCDGSLNCPPGYSKHDLLEQTARMQPTQLQTDKAFWQKAQSELSYKF